MVHLAMIGTMERRSTLAPQELFHLLMARNWLAIGCVEEAIREFNLLPEEAKTHPDADPIRHQLFSRS